MGDIKKKLKEYFSQIWNDNNKRVVLLMYLILPFAITLVIETLNQRSIIDSVGMIFTSFGVFLINVFIVAAILSLSLFFRKRIPVILLLTIILVGCGIANFIVKMNRETPFAYSDLQDFGSVISIFDKYLTEGQMVLLAIIVVIVIVLIVILWKKTPLYAEKLNYVRNVCIVIVTWCIMLLSVNIGQATGIVSVKFPNMSIAYKDFGFTYCFTYGFVSVGVEEPKNYDDEDIKSIVDKINNTITVDEENISTPNIIFLQLESFVDLENVIGLELSGEATPNFTRLKEEYTSGFLTVNNVGYGTANTEFEIMTGMNLEDFGPGEFPYKTILKEKTCESLCYILREYGYMSHAMHNNTGTFYSRNMVFKNLGYDTYTSVEYMNPTEYSEIGWVKDKILTDEIIKVLDSTEEPDYVYAISVQGHGAYPSYEIVENPVVEVTAGIDDEERINQFNFYANQIYEMDLFIGELINKLNAYDEEVILVMYGDHYPSLGIEAEHVKTGNIYQTEYIVWSNYGFEMKDKDLEAFQLGSDILKHLNIDGGVINKFHQVYQGEKDYLEALKKLEYDILYGSEYAFDGESPYIATDMQMGTYPVEVTDVYFDDPHNSIYPGNEEESPSVDVEEENSLTSKTEETTGDEETTTAEGTENNNETVQWIVVKGKEFTSYSRVFINDEKCETMYIDENTLLAYAPDMKNLDVIVVKQMWKEKTELSRSNEYMYIYVDDTQEYEE